MRILHVNKFLYRRGGAEAYMLDVASMQRADGHTVEFWSMSHPENDPAALAHLFAPRMELNPPPSGLAARVRTAAEMVWRPAARRGFTEAVAQFRPDVVHLHNIYHQLSPSILRAVVDVPTVMTLHDYKLACPTYQFLDGGSLCDACVDGGFGQAVRRRCNGGSLAASAVSALDIAVHTATGAYDPIDLFVCPSRFMRDKMTEAGVYPDRLVHQPHFTLVDSLPVADAPGTGVLFAGRLAHEKGVDTLLRATALTGSGIAVVIAGDGPDAAGLRALATDLGVADRVTFTGRLGADELHRRMRGSAAVVVPSRWYENQPMVVLEAMASGRAVIGSRLGGLVELVEDPDSGWLVDHDDPVALARALDAVAADPDEAHARGRRGRARAATTFSPRAHLDGLTDLYDRAARRVAA